MKVKFIVSTLLGLALANAKIIMLIRHGEKINDDYTDLSPEGKARAECLINTFGPDGIYISPQKIYAQKPTDKRQSTRPVDTVTPLAKSLGLKVDLSFSSSKFKDLAKEIKKSPEEVVLVSWANDRIPNIAEKFDIKKVPEWKGKIFDEIWVITDGTTPYVRDASANVIPRKTFKGKDDFTMEIVNEDIEECISERVAKFATISYTTGKNANSNDFLDINAVDYSANNSDSSNVNSTSNIVTGNIANNNESLDNELDSSSEIVKASIITLTFFLCMIFNLFN